MIDINKELNKIEISDFDYEKSLSDLHEAYKQDQETLKAKLFQVDQMRNDLLHIIELEPLNAPKIAQTTHSLKAVLAKRRIIKDRIEKLEAVKDEMRKINKDIAVAANKAKQKNKIMENRVYILRQLNEYQPLGRTVVVHPSNKNKEEVV